MATITRERASSVSIPVTLPQIAEGLRRLSKGEFETLTLLLDRRAMRTIEKSLRQAKRGKLREL